IVRVAQHLLPVWREVELARPQVPIPQSVTGALDGERVPFLAFAKRLLGVPALRPLGCLIERPPHGGEEAREPVLEDVVRDTALQDLDRALLTERARDEDEGSLRALALENR